MSNVAKFNSFEVAVCNYFMYIIHFFFFLSNLNDKLLLKMNNLIIQFLFSFLYWNSLIQIGE